MKKSGVDGKLGQRTEAPETQDQNLQSQESRVFVGNFDDAGGEGIRRRTPQRLGLTSSVDRSLALSRSDSQGSRAGLAENPADERNEPHADEDGYEERYEKLWRKGERHYITSNSAEESRGSERNDAGGGKYPVHHSQDRAVGDAAMQSRPDEVSRCDERNNGGITDALQSWSPHQPRLQSIISGSGPKEQSSNEVRPGGQPGSDQGRAHTRDNSSSNPWPDDEEIEAKRQVHWHNAFARLNGVEPKAEKGSSTSIEVNRPKRFSPFAFFRREPSRVSRNLEDLTIRRNFLLKLAKALLYFGAPPHRIESQLVAADAILNTKAEIVYLPNIVIVTMQNNEPNAAARTYFVRSKGRLALTSLHRVHMIYRDVLHDRMGSQEGIDALREILRAPPLYPLKFRCFLAFICSSIICVLSFGGSVVDMFISGVCASILQYLGLSAANKSSMYANVYEISVSIFVAFIARGLSSIPSHVFCYSAISSAGVVLILPGFTVLISSLELMSRNIFCGSVRIVYAIIYTLFLGFGLTIGSDFYLVLDRHARRQYYHDSLTTNLTYTHGQFIFSNSTSLGMVSGVIGTAIHPTHASNSTMALKVVKGCLRDDSWSWWRQPFPWYAVFALVPLYSICSSLSNLQSWRSIQLPVMVVFSCAAYAANKATSNLLPGRTDLVSAAGAFVIGLLGNIYSRVVRGTAFTSMVTGVLFLVPSGIAQGGGLNQNYQSSSEQYSVGFSLALRMISLASGVTVGLFVSQVLVYLFGSRKNGAHFAF